MGNCGNSLHVAIGLEPSWVSVQSTDATTLLLSTPDTPCIGMGGHEDIFVLVIKSLHIIHFWNPKDQATSKKVIFMIFATLRTIREVKKGFGRFWVS